MRFFWAVSLLTGCLPDITLPACATDSDCPRAEGYCRCSDGFCFKDSCPTDALAAPVFPACTPESAVRPGDACCAVTKATFALEDDCTAIGSITVSSPLAPSAGPGDTLVVVHGRTLDGSESSWLSWLDASGALIDEVMLEVGAPRGRAIPIGLGDGRVLTLSKVLRIFDLGHLHDPPMPVAMPALDLASPPAVAPSGRLVGLAVSGELVIWDGLTESPRTVPTAIGSDVEGYVALFDDDGIVVGGPGVMAVLRTDGSIAARLDAALSGAILPVHFGVGRGALVSVSGSELVGLGTTDGALWTTRAPVNLGGTGTAAVTLGDAQLVILAADGRTVWTVEVTAEGADPKQEITLDAIAVAPLVAVDGNLYATSTGILLAQYELGSATAAWRMTTSPPDGAPAVLVEASWTSDGSLLGFGADGRLRRFPTARSEASPRSRWGRARGDSRNSGWFPLLKDE